MQDLRERWIQFHEVSLESSPETAPPIPISQVINRLESRVKSGESYKVVENGNAVIWIRDFKRSTKHSTVSMLLQYADSSVTDPSFLHMTKGKLRREPKKDGEGVAVSAHVVISLEPHDELKLLYRLLLEEVPGLRRSKIAPFLKSEFKTVCKDQFEFHDEETNNKRKKYVPNLEISSKPVKELTSDFRDGVVLQSVEVVQLNPVTNTLDERGYYKTAAKTLRITVEDKAPVEEVIERVTKKAKKEGYDNVRVKYKKASGKGKTAEFRATEADLVDALVGHSEMVRSNVDLDQCMEKIVASIDKQMIEYLVAERN